MAEKSGLVRNPEGELVIKGGDRVKPYGAA